MRPNDLIRHGLLSAALLAACGTVQPGDGSLDGGLGDGRSGDDGSGGDGDAAPPGLLRLFYTSPVAGTSPLYVRDIVDGVAMDATLLSGTFGHASAGVSWLYLAADGRTAVFTADVSEEARLDLYLSRRSGGQWPGEPVRLSGDPGVLTFQRAFLEPDGSGVIYGLGSPAVGTIEQYYFVDLSTDSPGQPVPFGAGDAGHSEQLSADGSTFAYVQDGIAWVVDLTGAGIAPVRVSQPPADAGHVRTLALARDGSAIAFVGDLAVGGVLELWVVDLAGGAPGTPHRASGALVAGGDVAVGISGPLHYFSPDGRKLAFVADKSTDGVRELYLVDIAGGTPGAPQKVNGAMTSGGGVADMSGGGYYGTTPFSPDGRWIAYPADQRIDAVVELFVADVSGASPVDRRRVSGDLAAGGALRWFSFAPDSSGLLYSADQDVDDTSELYYLGLASGAADVALQVNGELVAGGDVVTPDAYLVPFSPDGQSIAYGADQRVDGREEVFLSRIVDGVPTAPVPVQEPTRDTSRVSAVEFSADGSTLVLRATTMAPTSEAWIVAGGGEEEPARIDASSQLWLWP